MQRKPTDKAVRALLGDPKKTPNPLTVADAFIKKNSNLAKNDTRNLFNYNPKTGLHEELVLGSTFNDLWQKFAKEFNLGQLCKAGPIKDIYNAIVSDPSIKKVTMNDYDDLICFENCILDLNTFKEIQFSPDFYFNTKTSIAYDSRAVNFPVFSKFLNTTFKDSSFSNSDEATINIIKQIGGYLLYPKSPAEMMFIFLGNGANGKSVLIEIFQMLFPKECLTGFNLSTLSEDSKELDRLMISRFNSATETRGDYINPERLKQIISGEYIELKRKHKETVGFIPQTKVIVASNTHPAFNDPSGGTDRRCYYINFNTKFVSKSEYENMSDEGKKFFRRELMRDKKKMLKEIEQEIPAIVNYFLDGLRELRENNWVFEETENSLEARNEQKESTNPLAVFLSENYELDKDSNLSSVDILRDYKAYYMEVNGSETKTGARGIGASIKTIFEIAGERKTMNGAKLRYYPLRRTTQPSIQEQSIKHGNVIKQLSFNKNVK